MIPLLHVHVTQPRCGRSEATGPRQATFLGLNGRFIREFGENRVRMGRFWSVSAGNPPKTGPEWVSILAGEPCATAVQLTGASAKSGPSAKLIRAVSDLPKAL